MGDLLAWASAALSPDGLYRYDLTRRWAAGGDVVAWVMLNPSTADADVDDPTIRRCVAFSRRWRFASLVVVNLFALRSTDPAALADADDPVGPDNGRYLARHLAGVGAVVVAAWGAAPMARTPLGLVQIDIVAGLAARRLRCLGTTADGSPRHPLYVRGDRPLDWWTPS